MFVCSVGLDKQDATRPEYAFPFQDLFFVIINFFFKTKTEKAMYAEKVGVDGSGGLK